MILTQPLWSGDGYWDSDSISVGRIRKRTLGPHSLRAQCVKTNLITNNQNKFMCMKKIMYSE